MLNNPTQLTVYYRLNIPINSTTVKRSENNLLLYWHVHCITRNIFILLMGWNQLLLTQIKYPRMGKQTDHELIVCSFLFFNTLVCPLQGKNAQSHSSRRRSVYRTAHVPEHFKQRKVISKANNNSILWCRIKKKHETIKLS